MPLSDFIALYRKHLLRHAQTAESRAYNAALMEFRALHPGVPAPRFKRIRIAAENNRPTSKLASSCRKLEDRSTQTRAREALIRRQLLEIFDVLSEKDQIGLMVMAAANFGRRLTPPES